MGEPLISSLVCGVAALSMVIWNWGLMELQRRSRCREVTQSRAKPLAALPLPQSKVRRDARVCHQTITKMEPMVLCSGTNKSEDSKLDRRLSQRDVKNRDRSDTSPLSPLVSESPEHQEDAAFFRDEN